MKVIIIGGVAGGMSAATRLRRLDEHAHIMVLERSRHVSFANCGLPYYVGQVITERESLLLQTPESLGSRFNIDVRVRHEATWIDREKKEVHIVNLDGGPYVESYDCLVLSPGAQPFMPDIPGIERALTLRTVEDVDRMAWAAGEEGSAVIMGGGFIGVELAENLIRRGLRVAMIEMADQVMSPLDPEMAYPVRAALEAHGVRLFTSATVTEIGADTVTISTGEELPAGIVISAIGVRPESRLAAESGLAMADRGGIQVDEHQRTSDPSIFAVGDAVQKVDAIDGSSALVPLAGPANRQGRLVADVICGRQVDGIAAQGTAIVGCFEISAAITGWNEKRLRAARRSYQAIHIHPQHHAGYYPGAEQMSLKLLFDLETGEILGAQAVGGAGVDKRIDVVATAMRGGLRAWQLANLDLAYAPQFGSAKDPVNMLGFIAENLEDGTTSTVQWHELAALIDQGVQVIDVRTPAEFERGAIPGAVNIPVDDLRERMSEVDDGRVVVHCQVGLRGHIAVRILEQHGRYPRNLDGGYKTWCDGMNSRRTNDRG